MIPSKGKGIKRVDIGSELPEVCELPDLIGIQTESFDKFLQLDKLERGEAPDPSYGLESVFRATFPIVSPNEDMRVEYNGYKVDMAGIKYTESECKKKGRTFGVPIKASVALETRNGEIKEKEIFFGDFPLMTDRGTFIINGAERVIVSQIVRSPGVVFKEGKKNDSSSLYYGTLYPYSGTKLEFVLTRKNEKTDTRKGELTSAAERKKVNNIIQVSFGKKPFPVTFFLRVLGIDTRDSIVKAFYEPKTIDISESIADDAAYFCYHDIRTEDGDLKFAAGDDLGAIELEELRSLGFNTVDVIDTNARDIDAPALAVIKTLRREHILCPSYRQEESEEFQNEYIGQIVEACRNSLPQNLKTFPDPKRVIAYFQEFFLNGRSFELSDIGRHKLNKKFYGMDTEKYITSTSLTPDDVVNTVRFLIQFCNGVIKEDDIDALGNRRVRTVGELLEITLSEAFNRMAKTAREKMNITDDSVKPQEIISIKPIVGAIKEFFGSSQLSQFMDQVNPLAELTHKRRVSALGPKGGLSRSSARAIYEVRDVHYTHYGR